MYVWKQASLTAACVGMLLTFVPWLPIPLSSYNVLAGGLPGATAMGMETTYLLEVIAPDFLAHLNAVLTPGDSVEALHMLARQQLEAAGLPLAPCEWRCAGLLRDTANLALVYVVRLRQRWNGSVAGRVLGNTELQFERASFDATSRLLIEHLHAL